MVGLALSIVSLLAINNLFITTGFVEAYPVLFKALFSIQTISLSAGFIGFFNTVFSGGGKFSRYLADSAYWVYLIHLPLVLFFQLILINSIFPGWLRFPLVILLTAGIAYLSYHYLVRDKWIGHLLNGKK
jgi:glucan biosynthesis protein C